MQNSDKRQCISFVLRSCSIHSVRVRARAHTDCVAVRSFIKSKRMFIIMSLESRFIIFNVIINFYFCASTFFVNSLPCSVHVFSFHPFAYIIRFIAYRLRLIIITCVGFLFLCFVFSLVDFVVFAWSESARAQFLSCRQYSNAICPHYRENHYNYDFFFFLLSFPF